MTDFHWPTRRFDALERSLDEVKSLVIGRSPAADDPVTSYLARFLVVRTCGYIEQTVELSCDAYIKRKSDSRTSSFASSWFGRGANPKPDALVKLVTRFDSEWGRELDTFLRAEDELLWRELSFLVDRRNKIAHGLSENIGVRKSLDLVESAKPVSGWFIDKFSP